MLLGLYENGVDGRIITTLELEGVGKTYTSTALINSGADLNFISYTTLANIEVLTIKEGIPKIHSLVGSLVSAYRFTELFTSIYNEEREKRIVPTDFYIVDITGYDIVLRLL